MVEFLGYGASFHNQKKNNTEIFFCPSTLPFDPLPSGLSLSSLVLSCLALCIQGVKRFDARVRVLEALTEKKLFRGKRDHPMALPICRSVHKSTTHSSITG